MADNGRSDCSFTVCAVVALGVCSGAMSLLSVPASRRYLNCGGVIGYAEDVLYYISRYFYQSGRSHDAFKDQRFWTDIFLSQVCLPRHLNVACSQSHRLSTQIKRGVRIHGSCCLVAPQHSHVKMLYVLYVLFANEISRVQLIWTTQGMSFSLLTVSIQSEVLRMQVHKTGAYRGDEPTVGLDYDGKVFQMFRAVPVSDKCVASLNAP